MPSAHRASSPPSQPASTWAPAPRTSSPRAPGSKSGFVWDIVDFIINAILFVLIGLQLHAIINSLSGYAASTLAGYALAVAGVVIATRLLWFFTIPYIVWAIDRRPEQRARDVGPGGRLVAAWSGLRGAVSLAAALAI